MNVSVAYADMPFWFFLLVFVVFVFLWIAVSYIDERYEEETRNENDR